MSEIPYSFSAFPLTMLSSSIILQIPRLTYTSLLKLVSHSLTII